MVPSRSSSRIARPPGAGYLVLGCLTASIVLHLLAMAVALHLPTQRRIPEPEPIPIEVVIELPRTVLPPAPSAPVEAGIEAPRTARAESVPAAALVPVRSTRAARPVTAASPAVAALLPHRAAPVAASVAQARAIGGAAAALALAAPRAPPIGAARIAEPATPQTIIARDPGERTRPAGAAAPATAIPFDRPIAMLADSRPAVAIRPAAASPRQPSADAAHSVPDAQIGLAAPPAPARAPLAAETADADAAGTSRVVGPAPMAARPSPNRILSAASSPIRMAPAPPPGDAATAARIAQSSVTGVVASSAAVRAIDPDQVREGIAKRLIDLPCSHLDVAMNEDLTPVIRGRVESLEDLALVREAGSAFSAGGEPVFAVEVLEAPFCSVLGQIETVGAGTAGPDIALNRPDATFAAGDFVVVTIAVPADLGRGYLNVLFVDLAGKVVHLLPNPYARDTQVHGGQTLRLGVEANERRAGVRDYQVTPPYGRGMLLVIWSSAPLPGLGTREVEQVEDLLAALTSAMAQVPPGGLRISRVAIVTHP